MNTTCMKNLPYVTISLKHQHPTHGEGAYQRSRMPCTPFRMPFQKVRMAKIDQLVPIAGLTLGCTPQNDYNPWVVHRPCNWLYWSLFLWNFRYVCLNQERKAAEAVSFLRDEICMYIDVAVRVKWSLTSCSSPKIVKDFEMWFLLVCCIKSLYQMFRQVCFWAKWQHWLSCCSTWWKILNFWLMVSDRSHAKICITGFRVTCNTWTTFNFPAFDGSQGLKQYCSLLSPDVTLSVNVGADLCFHNCNIMYGFSGSLKAYANFTWKCNKLRTRNTL